ncbi:hypothetical protein Tco_0596266 [Tanacetum coccineum]
MGHPVHHEVHVRTEVYRIVDEEEVHPRAVDEEDVRPRVVLEQIIKEQEKKIVDMQRRLLSFEQILNTQNTRPSDVDHNVVVEGINQSNVDHLDKNGNGSENVFVGGLDHQFMEGNGNDDSKNFPVSGLDHQSMEGVSHCMSVDHLDKNDKYESVAIDGIISLQSQDVDHISKKSTVVDDHDSKVKDNKESSHSDSFYLHKSVSLYDVGVSDSMDVDQPSLVNNILGDVHADSVVKDCDNP